MEKGRCFTPEQKAKIVIGVFQLRQYIIAMILVLAIILTGCNRANNHNTNTQHTPETQASFLPTVKPSSPQNTTITINEQANGEMGTFHLDMSRQDVLSILEDMNIDTSDEVEINSHPQAWNDGNKFLVAGGYSVRRHFAFGMNNTLFSAK